jgi:hypothetical protein
VQTLQHFARPCEMESRMTHAHESQVSRFSGPRLSSIYRKTPSLFVGQSPKERV